MTEAAVTPPQEPLPPYFSVSQRKFIVLWFCTLGFYGIYWFYMQWQRIKEREHSDIIPSLRAIFSIFFCYSLFDKVNSSARTYNVRDELAAGALATGFIILSLLWRLPDPYWLVTFLSIVFLAPAQNLMNKINNTVAPNAPTNGRFSGVNIAVVIIGGLIFILALVGTVFPEQ